MRRAKINLRLAFAWTLIAALAVGAGYFTASRHREQLLQRIVMDATRCAVAFHTDDVAQLTATRADLGTPAYTAVKARLMELRGIDPAVRFLYLFRSTAQPGDVIFLADSEPPGSPEESQPGDPYPEAPDSPGLQSILRDGRPATEGPLADSFGEWVTAYAQVGQAGDGGPRTILGLDVSASTWTRELWREGAVGAILVALLLGLPFGGWLIVRRERQFSRELQRFSVAIQQSHSGILITDLTRTIIYANAGSADATGYRADELIGQPARALLPPDLDDTLRQRVLATVRNGARWQGEIQLRRKNGEIFPVLASVSPVHEEGGRLRGFVMVFDDISEAKRIESALRLARDQAESADRAKGEFLAVMSHELRTPLNGIIGFASLLEDTALSSEQKDYTDTIKRSGEALLALTNELLDYSRIDAGRLRLDLQPCAPRHIVEEAIELLSARAAEKNLELIATVTPAVPAHVLADPGRLRQVIVNLVGNAIKFTPSGEVEVVVNAMPAPPAENDSGPRVRLEILVRDTGIGIAAEHQGRLFTPFTQLEPSATRRHGGTGLGLAISRSLARLMDGDIEVTSSAGAGSEFRIHLLARVVEPAEPLPPLPAKRIALISPNSRSRQHYEHLLQSWGLQVQKWESPERPPDFPVDGIVVDMVSRDAERWAQLLRAQGAWAGRPVVGLVPISVPTPVREELRGTLRALLKKPVREPLLHAVLTSLLKS